MALPSIRAATQAGSGVNKNLLWHPSPVHLEKGLLPTPTPRSLCLTLTSLEHDNCCRPFFLPSCLQNQLESIQNLNQEFFTKSRTILHHANMKKNKQRKNNVDKFNSFHYKTLQNFYLSASLPRMTQCKPGGDDLPARLLKKSKDGNKASEKIISAPLCREYRRS